jgi:hypothetical protein
LICSFRRSQNGTVLEIAKLTNFIERDYRGPNLPETVKEMLKFRLQTKKQASGNSGFRKSRKAVLADGLFGLGVGED